MLLNPTTEVPFVMKAISVDFNLKSVSFFMLGKLLPGPSNPVPFETVSDINAILDSFHKKKVCMGFKVASYACAKEVSTGCLINGSWHSKQCLNLCEDGKSLCSMCHLFKESVTRRQRRLRAKELLLKSISKTNKSSRKNRKIKAYRFMCFP